MTAFTDGDPVGARLRRLTRDAIIPAAAFVGDIVDVVFRRREDLVPPRPLRSLVGSAADWRDHVASGEEFVGYFRDLCGLAPDEAVLDVGCGSGRMAVPLTRYLKPAGAYEGFDIVAAAVKWCNRRIGARYPNFRFQHADVYNTRYNARGRTRASAYRFPYADARFDLAFACSVFTHLMPDAAEHYLAEIARVLRPGGRCLITFLLLTDDARSLIATGKSALRLPHDLGTHRVEHAAVPEAAVGYDEAYVRGRFAASGLRVMEPIRWGSWCGRSAFLSYQDIVIATKA
jgi:SAM-dependent methyltransferase